MEQGYNYIPTVEEVREQLARDQERLKEEFHLNIERMKVEAKYDTAAMRRVLALPILSSLVGTFESDSNEQKLGLVKEALQLADMLFEESLK